MELGEDFSSKAQLYVNDATMQWQERPAGMEETEITTTVSLIILLFYQHYYTLL